MCISMRVHGIGSSVLHLDCICISLLCLYPGGHFSNLGSLGAGERVLGEKRTVPLEICSDPRCALRGMEFPKDSTRDDNMQVPTLSAPETGGRSPKSQGQQQC